MDRFYSHRKAKNVMFSSPSGLTVFDRLTIDVRLRAGSPAIDAGIALPGFNDGFVGSAPDLGAFEFGSAAPHYGPRPEK